MIRFKWWFEVPIASISLDYAFYSIPIDCIIVNGRLVTWLRWNGVMRLTGKLPRAEKGC